MVLFLFFAPIVFTITVWGVVRFFNPLPGQSIRSPYFRPDIFPFPEDPVREPMLVGARTIRETGRQRNRINALASPYDYTYGSSVGLPEAWWEDVLRRRN